jgi:hypothetical protein
MTEQPYTPDEARAVAAGLRMVTRGRYATADEAANVLEELADRLDTRSVQPPTREQIAEALHGAPHGEDCGAYMDTDYGPAFTSERMCTCWKRDFLALFPQPTPSAEHQCSGPHEDGRPESCVCSLGRSHNHDEVQDVPAEPVSIAEMAPGTTFTATQFGSRRTRYWMRLYEGVQVWWHPCWEAADEDDIDLSTIRDVTPPPATPEKGDRG